MQALLLSVVPLVFLVALLLTALYMQRVSEDTATATRRATEALTVSSRVYAALDGESRAFAAESRRHAAANQALFRRSAAQIAPTFATIGSLAAGDPDPGRTLETYRRRTLGITAVLSPWMRDLAAGHLAAVRRATASPKNARLGADWAAAKLAFEEHERAAALARFDVLHERVGQLEEMMLSFAVVGIVLTLAVAAQFGLRITARLRRLAENARALVDGRPAAPIAGHDEIAALDAVYRELTHRLEREQRAAATLQRALLPQTFPAMNGLRIDSAYVPAGEGADIGGDWYDVFALSSRAIGISAGDVAGHGLRAAAIMGGVRQSIRTAARVAGDPSSVLRHVNRALCADEPETYVTAFYGVLDLDTRVLRFAIAGHPGPLLVHATSDIVTLAGDGLVLGVDPLARFREMRATVGAGDALVIYTDGIVEVDRDYLAGTRGLAAAVLDELAAPSDNVADGIQRRIFRDRKPRDDSALLYIGIAEAAVVPSDVRDAWAFDARNEFEASRVRLALLAALAAGNAPCDLGATQTIFGELLGNVARHTPGLAYVSIELRDGDATLCIEDEGEPFALETECPDVLAESGRGLFLVRALGEGVTLERTARGNRVSVVLPHAAQRAAELAAREP